jgi:hypothetical protein
MVARASFFLPAPQFDFYQRFQSTNRRWKPIGGAMRMSI